MSQKSYWSFFNTILIFSSLSYLQKRFHAEQIYQTWDYQLYPSHQLALIGFNSPSFHRPNSCRLEQNHNHLVHMNIGAGSSMKRMYCGIKNRIIEWMLLPGEWGNDWSSILHIMLPERCITPAPGFSYTAIVAHW